MNYYPVVKIFGVFEVTGTYSSSLVFFKIGALNSDIKHALYVMTHDDHAKFGCVFEQSWLTAAKSSSLSYERIGAVYYDCGTNDVILTSWSN